MTEQHTQNPFSDHADREYRSSADRDPRVSARPIGLLNEPRSHQEDPHSVPKRHHTKRTILLVAAVVLTCCVVLGGFLAIRAADEPTREMTPVIDSAQMLSELFGCTRPPGAPEQMTAGTQVYNCVGEAGDAYNIYLYVFTTPGDAMGMRKVASTIIDVERSKGRQKDFYVYGDGWAVMGSDRDVIAAAVNEGGVELA